MRKGIEKIQKKEGRKMARTIKIDDELFERVMEKKSGRNADRICEQNFFVLAGTSGKFN